MNAVDSDRKDHGQAADVANNLAELGDQLDRLMDDFLNEPDLSKRFHKREVLKQEIWENKAGIIRALQSLRVETK